MEPPEVSERALLDRVVRGDAAAFEALYTRLERPLMTLCSAILMRRDLAEEAMQDALLEFLKLRARWAAIRSPRAYLFQIARRRALDLRAREGKAPSPASHPLRLVEARDPSDPDALARQEALDGALRRLPDSQREAVVLKHLSGLTLAEIAEVVQENPKTLESRYAAGMARLREILSREEGP